MEGHGPNRGEPEIVQKQRVVGVSAPLYVNSFALPFFRLPLPSRYETEHLAR